MPSSPPSLVQDAFRSCKGKQLLGRDSAVMKSKRIILLALSLAFCLSVIGCGCDHVWIEATCTEPKTCEKCGETEGEALGHNFGEWQQTIDALTATVSQERECDRCGQTEAGDSQKLTSFINGGEFIISTYEYEELFLKRLNELEGSGYSLDHDSDPTQEMYEISAAGDELAGMLTFSDRGEILKTYKSGGIRDYGVAVLVESDREQDRNRFLIAMIRACDPSLSHDDASKVGAAVIDFGECGKNGIVYSRTNDGSFVLLEAVLGEAEDRTGDVNTSGGVSGTGAANPWK